VRTYTNFTSFRLSCGLRRSKNRETAGIFGTGCVIVIPSRATLYRPCGGNTNMYLVPIFSPERWQSIGSSAPLSPPQERTVSRRRRETTKCASALNSRMIFGTAATTATQKFRRPDSKSFCRFRDAAVPRNRQTGSTENSRSAHLYKLHFVSFVVRSATLKKPRNGGNFRDRMCNCNTVTRDAITITT
jgi:hypothetical protein